MCCHAHLAPPGAASWPSPFRRKNSSRKEPSSTSISAKSFNSREMTGSSVGIEVERGMKSMEFGNEFRIQFLDSQTS